MGKVNDKQPADILGCKVHLVNLNEAVEKVATVIETRKITAHIITANAEILYRARNDHLLANIIKKAHLITPDGIGVVWAASFLGYQPQGRVTGIELMEAICREGAQRDWKIFLFGAAPGVAEQAAYNLTNKYSGLQIAGIINGYFAPEEEREIIASIKRADPDILFVGLGAPRQEFWINLHREELRVPVSIGIGGSFDVISCQKKRAPAWIIKSNLEWLYRLVNEPSRIKRQIALPKFVLAVLQQKYKRRL